MVKICQKITNLKERKPQSAKQRNRRRESGNGTDGRANKSQKFTVCKWKFLVNKDGFRQLLSFTPFSPYHCPPLPPPQRVHPYTRLCFGFFSVFGQHYVYIPSLKHVGVHSVCSSFDRNLTTEHTLF